MQQYQDALFSFHKAREIYEKLAQDPMKNGKSLSFILKNTGNCLNNLQQYEDALIYLKQTLNVMQSISLINDLRKDADVAFLEENIENCLRIMHD